MSATGHATLGRFELVHCLARGGQGEVYLALQKSLGEFEKPVALKLLLPHLADDTSVVRAFVEEARLLARMSHPNLVAIHDVGLEQERYYIAMELVRGVSLARLVKRLSASGQRLSGDVIAYVGRALCAGLHHAHELKGQDGLCLELVHRDVTPQNVLVSVDGAVKLVDFGIAKVRQASHATAPGIVKGKLEYIAPENLDGKPMDRRADIYSAGLTLYHLATHQSPFYRETEGGTVMAIAREPLPPLELRRPDLPPALCAAIERAARKDPSERFSTALELRAALPERAEERAAEQLGQQVSEVCASELRELDLRARQAVRRSNTLALAIPNGTEQTQRSAAPPALRRRWAVAASGMGAAALIAAVALTRWPVAAPAPAPPSTERIAADPHRVQSERPAGSPPAQAPQSSFGVAKDPLQGPRRPRPAEPATLDSNVAVGSARAGPEPVAAGVGSRSTSGLAAALEASDTPAHGFGTPEPKPSPAQRSAPAALTPAEAAARGASSGTPTSTSPLSESSQARTSSSTERPGKPARPGYLSIDAVPWANVTVNGRPLGETPIARYPVAQPEVRVLLSNPQTGKVVRRRLRVSPGKIATLREDMR